MQLTFLEADEALSKTYKKKPNGDISGSSYPNAYQVTSHVEIVENIREFCSVLKMHAELGHCLHTSTLEKELKNESRAKMSIENECPEWLVLDLDGMDFNSAEDFIRAALPKQFHDVSYIEQHSPSSGIKPGLRIHVFFLLDAPQDRKILSDWLKYTNLDTASLSNQITLSKSGQALTYTLDVVANNPGRIVYICAPECEGFSDPVKKRIVVVKKKYDELSFNFAGISSAKLRQDVRAKINELRSDAGLPVSRKGELYDYYGDREYLKKDLTEPARITDAIEDNDRFMRCNLDGGNSWAYYYYRDRPEWLHNFKGEPSLHIPSLDPHFYDAIAKPYADTLKEKDKRPFVFRDIVTDKYYVGIRKEDKIIEQPNIIGSRDKIDDYFAQQRTSPPDPLPSWTRDFDPTSEKQWDPDRQMFNFWRPTEYIKNATYRSLPPLKISNLIAHVTGDDPESYTRFINWLAYIFQKRKKSGTAWVLHGVPGTGKGVLYNYVIRPLFGHDYCQTKQVRELKANFNGWMEHAIFVNIDETNTEDAGAEEGAVIEALKLWITDPIISIEAKHQNARMANNFSNFIFTSNDFGALPIQDGDRRFNVAPRQEKPIVLSPEDIEDIGKELQPFAGYLSGYDVSIPDATKPMDNDAKQALRAAARSSIDEFVHSLKDGDLAYFVEGLGETTSEYTEKDIFKKAVDQWLDDAKHDRVSQVSHPQLKAAYVVICTNRPMLTNRFLSLMTKRGYPSAYRKDGDARWRGWRGEWKLDKEDARNLKVHLKPVKTEEQIEKEIKKEIDNADGAS